MTKEIVEQAHKRFKLAQEFSSRPKNWSKQDVLFANGDERNNNQWDSKVYTKRDGDERPCLTINLTKRCNLLIENDIKKNQPVITISPLSFGATVKSAMLIKALFERLQNNSNARLAFNNSEKWQIEGGLGWYKLEIDYENFDSFNLEIFIRSIYDPMCVECDPWARMPDRSDMNFAFEFQRLNDDEFKEKYPDFKKILNTPFSSLNMWRQKNEIIIADYYRKVKKKDKLLLMPDGSTKLLSKIPPRLRESQKSKAKKIRETESIQVEKILIAGGEVIDEIEKIPGNWIPLVSVVGEETVIDGKLDQKGHTRNLLSSQRMYNYFASMGVEYAGVQTKAPFIGPTETYGEHQDIWENANNENYAYLPFVSYDEDGNKLDKPERVQPPMSAPAALEGMKVAAEEIDKISGQYGAALGETDNSRTNAAMNTRISRSDLGIAHFGDNAALSRAHAGRIALGWFPHVYKKDRLIEVYLEDSVDPVNIRINPEQGEAVQEKAAEAGQVAEMVLNLKVGAYAIKVDSGPGFATRREQSQGLLGLILTQSPELINVIGDLLFKASDFVLADEAATRLKRLVSKEALGEGPSKEEQQLKQQNEMLLKIVEKVTQRAKELEGKLEEKDFEYEIKALEALEKADVNKYNAFTKRLQAILSEFAEKNLGQMELNRLVMDAFKEILGFDLEMRKMKSGQSATAVS